MQPKLHLNPLLPNQSVYSLPKRNAPTRNTSFPTLLNIQQFHSLIVDFHVFSLLPSLLRMELMEIEMILFLLLLGIVVNTEMKY